MAHKKGVGSSKNGRESASKRLGVKIFGGRRQTLCICNPRRKCRSITLTTENNQEKRISPKSLSSFFLYEKLHPICFPYLSIR